MFYVRLEKHQENLREEPLAFSLIISYIYKENARGSPHNVLLTFSQSYVKHDLRKNKIVVASTTDFLGFSTKIETLTLNLG
jgi:hypothetical protein